MCVFFSCFWFILFHSFFLFSCFSHTLRLQLTYNINILSFFSSIEHTFGNNSDYFIFFIHFRHLWWTKYRLRYICKSVSWVKIRCQKQNEIDEREREGVRVFPKFHLQNQTSTLLSFPLTFSSLYFFPSIGVVNCNIVKRHFQRAFSSFSLFSSHKQRIIFAIDLFSSSSLFS